MRIRRIAPLILAFSVGAVLVYLRTGAHSQPAEQCQGNNCLQILERRTGSRCGKSDSLDVAIQNVSSENLRGGVVFGTPSGSLYVPHWSDASGG